MCVNVRDHNQLGRNACHGNPARKERFHLPPEVHLVVHHVLFVCSGLMTFILARLAFSQRIHQRGAQQHSSIKLPILLSVFIAVLVILLLVCLSKSLSFCFGLEFQTRLGKARHCLGIMTRTRASTLPLRAKQLQNPKCSEVKWSKHDVPSHSIDLGIHLCCFGEG